MSRIVLWLSAVLLLSACVPVVNLSPLPTPTSAVMRTVLPTTPPQQGTSLIVGQVTGQPNSWKGQQLVAYAAPFKPTTEGNGFFILEPSIHPSAVLDLNGTFQIKDVPADAYVIVVGPTPEEALAVQEAGHARVVQVKADQTLDLGKIDLR